MCKSDLADAWKGRYFSEIPSHCSFWFSSVVLDKHEQKPCRPPALVAGCNLAKSAKWCRILCTAACPKFLHVTYLILCIHSVFQNDPAGATLQNKKPQHLKADKASRESSLHLLWKQSILAVFEACEETPFVRTLWNSAVLGLHSERRKGETL